MEKSEINCLRHGMVAEIVGMEMIFGSEARRQSGRTIEIAENRVKIDHAVEGTAGPDPFVYGRPSCFRHPRFSSSAFRSRPREARIGSQGRLTLGDLTAIIQTKPPPVRFAFPPQIARIKRWAAQSLNHVHQSWHPRITRLDARAAEPFAKTRSKPAR